MKKSTRLFFKVVIISAWCVTVFVGVGYYYLSRNLSDANNEDIPSVPYSQEMPQNAGVLLDISGDKTFVYLDFQGVNITAALFFEQGQIIENSIYGYPIDFYVNADLDLIICLVDCLDGIELDLKGETLRYTGVQVADIIAEDKQGKLKLQIFKAILKRAESNFTDDRIFFEILNKYDTNLTVPDFYYWTEFIDILASNLRIIDG